MKKSNKIIINQREIDLLNKYYEIDNDNMLVTMPLHYEKASDLTNDKIISKDNYLFDYEELTSINDMIRRVPVRYKININIQIDDYEDYDAKKLLAGFNDAMELNQYNYQRERRINFLRAGILLIIGMAILFYIAYAKINNWFGTENDISVYAEVFDIVGWVFIWETVTVAFLTPSELGINSNMFRLRVLNVKFLDIFNQVLVEESLANEASKWESEKKLEKVSRFALLFSGVALIALSIFSITTYINTIIDIPSFYPDDKSGMAIAYIVSITIATIATIIEFLGGFVALSRYAGRRFLPKFGNLFTILISIILILDIIGSVGSLTVIIRSSAVFVITLVYLFGYISNAIITKNKYFFRKEIKKEENTNEIGE